MSMHVEGSVVPSRLALVQLKYQQWRSPAIDVATQLGIAEALVDGTCTVAELVEATSTHAPSLHRFCEHWPRIRIFIECDGVAFRQRLSCCAGMFGIVAGDGDGGYDLRFDGGALGGLLHSVQTDEPGFDKIGRAEATMNPLEDTEGTIFGVDTR